MNNQCESLCNPRLMSGLTKRVGITNSIIYSQLVALLMHSTHRVIIKRCCDEYGNTVLNHIWIRCDLKTMNKFIPYMTTVTITKHLRWLYKHGFIHMATLDRDSFNHTHWYSLNLRKYHEIKSLELKRDVLLCK